VFPLCILSIFSCAFWPFGLFRLNQFEDRLLELKEKVDQLEHSDKEKNKKVQIEHAVHLGHHSKAKPMNYGHRKRRGDAS
jgi:predicted metal-dependent TIM-barrel fold hydrolase